MAFAINIERFIKNEIAEMSFMNAADVSDDKILLYDCTVDDYDLIDIILDIDKETGKLIPGHFNAIDVHKSTVGDLVSWVKNNIY